MIQMQVQKKNHVRSMRQGEGPLRLKNNMYLSTSQTAKVQLKKSEFLNHTNRIYLYSDDVVVLHDLE